MDWKTISVPSGSKLYKVHYFNYMHQGIHFTLEVDEFLDGSFTGHGEHSTDKNFVIESVSGANTKECINALVSRINTRIP